MKRKSYTKAISFIVFFAIWHTGLSQTEVNTSFAARMNYIFANLDKSKVPYGVLRDYGMEFTNLENYNGTAVLADTNTADAITF